jgi:(p)ppGpp synthase/HD superfamily hydrolase
MENELILKATVFAAKAHAQQRRKANKEPYVNHLVRVGYEVAKTGHSVDAICAAILHDTVEDTAVTVDELKQEFSARTVELVVLLTQWWADDASPEEKKSELPKYYRAILQDMDATSIKLFDRADNLNEMVRTIDLVPQWAERYYKKSVAEMAELLKSNAHVKAREACQQAIQNLKDAIETYKTSGAHR